MLSSKGIGSFRRVIILVSAIAILCSLNAKVVPLSDFMPVSQFAYAADGDNIRTSADSHDMKFFGESVVQVVIIDESASDSSDDEISVTVEADSNAGDDSKVITIPNTHAGSQRFEFFLANAASKYADGIDEDNGGKILDANNVNGIDDPSDGFDGSGAPIIRFGIDQGTGVELDTGTDLYDRVSITITHGDESKKIKYEETIGSLNLDRISYGTDSFVYVTIRDQDANLNPFEHDTFTVDPNNDPNQDLLTLDGGSFEGIMVYEETGDNTGAFEGKYRLGVSIDVSSETLSLTLHDKSNYDANLDVSENDSNNTDQVSFTVGNSSGNIQIGGNNSDDHQIITTWDPLLVADKNSYTIGEIVHVNITDQDANTDPNLINSIKIQLISSNHYLSEISALETDKNTGIFEASILLSSTTNVTADSVGIQDGSILTIKYTDKYPADYFEKVEKGETPDADFTLDIQIQRESSGQFTLAAPKVKIMNDTDGNASGIIYPTNTQLVIHTDISDNIAESQKPFVAIFEVRNSHGVTIFLGWYSGSQSSSNIEVSWFPKESGIYEVRTFAISQFDNGEVLSPVATTGIIVQ